MTEPPTVALMRETVAFGVQLERLNLAAMTTDQQTAAITRARTEHGRWHADDAMYAGTHTAAGMTSLIHTLAALSLAEGGVTWQGLHWCPDHAQCVAAGAA